MKASNIVLVLMLGALLGGCTVLAGNLSHWPASLAAVAVLVPLKFLNDRRRFVAWPMEFLLISGVVMIVFNLIQLYFTPLSH
jgi:predicted membrane protein